MASLTQNSSGDVAGNYSTGSEPSEEAAELASVTPPNNGPSYLCPGSSAEEGNSNPSFGPFTGTGYMAANLGPVGTHKVWTPFAAWNQQQTVLPLPHTIQGTLNGFQFSQPPVFNSGNDYSAQLPNDDTQPPAQYYGNSQSDFWVAPATSLPQPAGSFPLPGDGSTPFTQLEGCSDWAATVSLANASGAMQVTFANGSPLAFLDFDTPYAWFVPTGGQPDFWYPQGYTPAGVEIGAGGGFPVSAGTAGVVLTVTYGGASASYTTQEGDTEPSVVQSLQQQCQATFMTLNVTSAPNDTFILSGQSGPISVSDVVISPTANAPNILTESSALVPVDPSGEMLGFTVTGQAQPAAITYFSSYLLIAPAGSSWTLQNGGAALACQFPSEQGGTIVVVAMPDVPASAYSSYYTPETGAAAILQSYWAVMSPFAYGCPQHFDGNGNDDGTGTQFGPNTGSCFTPQVTMAGGTTTVTTELSYNLTYPAGQPDGASGTLFGLFPHQWRAYANNTATPLQTAAAVELTYQTVMGTLKLCGGEGFSTTYTFPGILAAIPNAAGLTGAGSLNVFDYLAGQGVNATTLSDQMAQDTSTPDWGSSGGANAFLPIPPCPPTNAGIDSYDWGKYVAGVADLIQPAFLLGNTAAGQDAISQLNAQLGQWLSGALLYADASTPFPPGVEPWQTQQGNTTFAGTTGLDSNQQFLFYDQQWSSFIPYPTAYYADTLLNDHHFHYGYWLRAAAQLALAQAMSQDPNNGPGTFIDNYGATVNLLVKEIANPLRADPGVIGDSAAVFPNGPATPFLRYFDGYFGHSWASGLPLNILNQESLSEAMSAWTGVILWGALNSDTNMLNLGIWMYTHEMLSFYEYWMDCAQNASDTSTLFPAGSSQNIVGDAYATSIQGGSTGLDIGFCTQVYNSYLELTSDFGMDPLYLTGIEWLPFHGGSLYLSSTDTAVSSTLLGVFDWAQQNSQSQWNVWLNSSPQPQLTAYQPTYFATGWEPVAWNHAATLGEDTAANIWSALEQAVGTNGTSNGQSGNWTPLAGQSVSYSYYWINNLCTLGARDATVSADYPFAVKFLNGTTATYVVWNLTGSNLDVTFSDGQSVSGVAAYSMQVSPGS